MNKTNIEYVDFAWNPTHGCTPISDGCKNCWAERMSKRLAGMRVAGYDPSDPFKVTCHPDRLQEPMKVKKPSRIAVSFMGDLFHKDVPDEFIRQVFDVMDETYQHTFFVLTKRPKKMARCLYDNHGGAVYEYVNTWFGVSVENQCELMRRTCELCDVVRDTSCNIWLSVEPMLGPITLDDWTLRNIGWVVIGCESGPGARPCKLEWVRDLAKQCSDAGIPYYVKQLTIDGKACSDMTQFPEDLRHREVV